MSPKSQVFGKFPYHVKTTEKIVALTFDDGPNEPFTSQIVDFLDNQKIKASFFQVGKCVEKFPATTLKIYKSGHTVGIHSLSHKFSKYFTQPRFRDEINKSQAIIAEVIGVQPRLFRPPWLWRQPFLLLGLKKLNLQPVSGLFCSNLEVAQINAKTIAKHALAKVRPGAIIIFHDGYNSKGGNRSQTVEAVKITVKELQSQGYRFVTVDQLLGVEPYSKQD
ncbi:MAG: polysaccharide deacetylase family protein [Candidatus Saccharimonadales bacterium]